MKQSIVQAKVERGGRLIGAMLALALVAGCATAPNPQTDPEGYAEYREINDPLEPFNRGVFEFNRALDFMFLKPFAEFYRGLTPPIFQEAVHNVLNNIRTPVVLANDLLQGKWDRAQTTVTRFAINTTAGVGGLVDRATDWGYEYHGEDFGQTLAVWGVDSGPYLMLPIFGPSNPRDATGLAVDSLLNPINWWARNSDGDFGWVPFAIGGLRALDIRSRNYEAIEDLEKSSLDFYAAVRSLYRQRRADEITDGKGTANIPAPGFGGSSGVTVPPADEEVSTRPQ